MSRMIRAPSNPNEASFSDKQITEAESLARVGKTCPRKDPGESGLSQRSMLVGRLSYCVQSRSPLELGLARTLFSSATTCLCSQRMLVFPLEKLKRISSEEK